jgi:biopolymer transport protein ExbD
MERGVSVWLGAVLAVALAAGCATAPRGGSVDVTLDGNGTLHVGDRAVALHALADAVRGAGAVRDTRICVALPAEAAQADVRRIVRALAAGGFPKVVFTRPRKASAVVDPLP